MKKYKLTEECKEVNGIKLHRIRALASFGNKLDRELGGYVYGDDYIGHEADYAIVKGFGSECRSTTFYRQKDGSTGVKCGCFSGTLEKFRKKVRETHGESKFAREYLMIADLMEMHFGEKEC